MEMTEKDIQKLITETRIHTLKEVYESLEEECCLRIEHIVGSLDNIQAQISELETELEELNKNLYQVRREEGITTYLGVFRATSSEQALVFAAKHHGIMDIASGGNGQYKAVMLTEEYIDRTKKIMEEQLQLATTVLN
jgi:uncharacterized protein (UPF0297 family)